MSKIKPACPLNVERHLQVSALCFPWPPAATLSPHTITSRSSPPDARNLPPLLHLTQFTHAGIIKNIYTIFFRLSTKKRSLIAFCRFYYLNFVVIQWDIVIFFLRESSKCLLFTGFLLFVFYFSCFSYLILLIVIKLQ